jgi:hypothetical protein
MGSDATYSCRAEREMRTLVASVETGTLGIIEVAKRAHHRAVVIRRNATSALSLLVVTLKKPVLKDFHLWLGVKCWRVRTPGHCLPRGPGQTEGVDSHSIVRSDDDTNNLWEGV